MKYPSELISLSCISTDTLMSSDDCTIDEPVGGMCISISETDGNLVAYLSSNYSMYGKGACNEVVSIVDRNFYLVQEKNVEQLNCEDYHAVSGLFSLRLPLIRNSPIAGKKSPNNC